ncbi:zinc finger CCCH domain-containing protein 13 [Venturia canescens]|uniref:zinc finger CCCH domain-containing protein 13 n=1 Tax=Venturia canescens TaxID=32260 RepID=UPI001C9CE85D|nr:zinc finger CCCH domain-containing protein 13 [Venturia canescens]
MTTMDSDSASQDSDDGRRFRFEATRKDSNSGIDTRRKKSLSPRRQEPARRSRSREHKNRQRHDRSRERQEQHRKRREFRDSGGRESSKNSRTLDRLVPHSAHRSSSPKYDRRESRNYENKRSREYSSQDRKDSSERRDRHRDSKRFSRDRSRDRNSQSSSTKTNDFPRSRDHNCEDSGSSKKSRSIEPGKSSEDNPAKRESNAQEYKELNLSDFDIISDTEEITSDESSSRRSRDREKSQTSENDDDLKRKVSKHHYERLLKRQATKRRRSSEDLNCPKQINGTGEPSEVPNFSLNDKRIKDPKMDISTEKIGSREDLAYESDGEVVDELSWGPALPPNKERDEKASRSRDSPTFQSSDKKVEKNARILGPELPLNFRPCDHSNDEETEDTFGPVLPPHLSSRKNIEEDKAADSASEDNDDYVGPLPMDHPAMENDMVQHQLEMRARRLKAELAACDKEEEKKREEWMTELPPAKGVNLGLGPRKFRIRPAPDMSDRSSWTDTPVDRARKRMEKLENKSVPEPTISKERVRETRHEAEKSQRHPKSLLEIHQKKMHKKKKKEEKEAKKNGKKTERRPFDRDVDLQANRFDEARKKSMFLHARHLDDRFSRGKI